MFRTRIENISRGIEGRCIAILIILILPFLLTSCSPVDTGKRSTSTDNELLDNESKKLQTTNQIVTFKWIETPIAEVKSGQFLLTFKSIYEPKDSNLIPSTFNTIPVFDLNVYLWMPSMNHGSSPVKIFYNEQTHEYFVHDVFFIMPGVWEIIIQLYRPKTKVLLDTAVYTVEIK